MIEVKEKKETVYVFKCVDSVVQVKGKLNSIAMGMFWTPLWSVYLILIHCCNTMNFPGFFSYTSCVVEKNRDFVVVRPRCMPVLASWLAKSSHHPFTGNKLSLSSVTSNIDTQRLTLQHISFCPLVWLRVHMCLRLVKCLPKPSAFSSILLKRELQVLGDP